MAAVIRNDARVGGQKKKGGGLPRISIKGIIATRAGPADPRAKSAPKKEASWRRGTASARGGQSSGELSALATAHRLPHGPIVSFRTARLSLRAWVGGRARGSTTQRPMLEIDRATPLAPGAALFPFGSGTSKKGQRIADWSAGRLTARGLSGLKHGEQWSTALASHHTHPESGSVRRPHRVQELDLDPAAAPP